MGLHTQTHVLASIELFNGLDAEQIADVERRGHYLELDAGTILFRFGDDADTLFVVLEGRLDLFRDSGRGDERVGTNGAGEAVGEISALAGVPRTATARARRATTVFRLDSVALETIARTYPSVGWELARHAAQITNAVVRGGGTQRSITLVLGSSSNQRLVIDAVTVADLTARVVRASEIVHDVGTDPRSVGAELERSLRDGCDMYVVDDDDLVVLPVADRVILVTDNGPDAVWQAVDEIARQREQRGIVVDVVVVHENVDAVPVAFEHLDSVDSLCRVRTSVEADHRRVGRLLTGQARALVLGGGGARAFAQFGVLRAFVEHGWEFDHVVGSGTGSLVGALFAAGRDPDTMAHDTLRALRVTSRWPSIPSVSVFDGGMLRRGLRQLFGRSRVEDTWIPLTICTTDLSGATTVAVNRGSAVRWVEAATAMPGVHPPATADGHLLLDGALLEPLPVRRARALGAVHVTAIDTIPRRTQLVDAGYEAAPGGLSWFAQLVPIHGVGFPGMAAIVDRAMNVAQHAVQLHERQSADVLISPPVDRFGALDVLKVHELAKIGYLEAARVLDREVDNA